ncbi:response regulator transcription factor [Thermocrinis sp.]
MQRIFIRIEPEYTRTQKKLSKREEEVLTLFLLEKSYRDIAEELNISVSSVREYINRALSKLSMDKEELKKLYKESSSYNTSK